MSLAARRPPVRGAVTEGTPIGAAFGGPERPVIDDARPAAGRFS